MRDSEFRIHIPELPKRNDEELSRKPLLTGTPSESEVLPILNEKIVTYVRSSVSWFLGIGSVSSSVGRRQFTTREKKESIIRGRTEVCH